MIDLEILRAFCSDDETRFELFNPFTQGNYTFATDGRTVVRVPKIIAGARTEPVKADAAGLFKPELMGHPELMFPEGWQHLPELWEECGTCAGVGRCQGMLPCTRCEGSGEEECPTCLNMHDCEECRGSGEIKGDANAACEWCDGLGKVEVVTRILGMPGEVCFNDRYLRRVYSLPGVVMTHDPSDPMKTAHFVFEGGDGLIMPMRAQTEQP